MRYHPRTRLVFLGVVNGLILAHIVAYYAFDKTRLGCIDFFGLATFAGKGQLTAGTFFLGALFLLTLLVGRVFCGWGCHFAFFQDLLSRVLDRAHIRVPFRRGRAEYIVPPLLVLVTLAYPILVWWRDRGLPRELSVDLSYPDLWHLLPGAKGVVLILFVDVILLTLLFGGRAFCRFVCPYGLILKPLHTVSPVRVTKTSECNGCGSCAAACPVGVPLKREIEAFGVVHDLNCMNCGDCVAVCPTGAISLRPTRKAYTRAFEVVAIRFKEPVWVDVTLVLSACAGLFLLRGQEFGDFLSVGLGLVCGACIVIGIEPSQLTRLSKRDPSRVVLRVACFGVALFLAGGIAGQALTRYVVREGERRHQHGDYDGALHTYARAAPLLRILKPTTFYLDDFNGRRRHISGRLVGLGEEFLLKEDWQKAIIAYERAADLDPSRTAIYGNLGTALLKSGNYWAAAQNYMRVLEDDPNDLVALYHLAMTRIQLKQLDESVRLVQRILNIDTEGNAYDLIRANPLFHLLEWSPDYRRSMTAYGLLHPARATDSE